MPGGWKDSDRRERLPTDWPSIRKRVLRRDGYRCTEVENGVRCVAKATDVDHVRPGDDHRESNLTSLCGDHHQAKSSREGARGRAIALARSRKKFRRTETHPGLR